eukprot:366546-Chlamydomonas_euryale.AAC.58
MPPGTARGAREAPVSLQGQEARPKRAKGTRWSRDLCWQDGERCGKDAASVPPGPPRRGWQGASRAQAALTLRPSPAAHQHDLLHHKRNGRGGITCPVVVLLRRHRLTHSACQPRPAGKARHERRQLDKRVGLVVVGVPGVRPRRAGRDARRHGLAALIEPPAGCLIALIVRGEEARPVALVKHTLCSQVPQHRQQLLSVRRERARRVVIVLAGGRVEEFGRRGAGAAPRQQVEHLALVVDPVQPHGGGVGDKRAEHCGRRAADEAGLVDG